MAASGQDPVPVPPAATGAARVCDRVLLGAVTGLALTSTFSISVTQILLGVATLAFVARVAATRDLRAFATGVGAPLAALLIWAVAMVPLSGDPQQSAVFLRRFWLMLLLFIAAGLARGPLGRPVRRTVLVALLAGGVGTAVYGLVAYSRAGGAFVDAWDGFLKNRVVLLQGYMTAGGLMMITELVVLAFLLTARRARTRLWLGLAGVPMGAALLLTLTRSAWLGFGAGAVAMLLMARRRLAVAVVAAAAVLVVLVPGQVHDRFLSVFAPGNAENAPRLVMWRMGAAMVKDHPLTGVGDRDLNELYWQYRERAAGGPVAREAYPTGPILVVGHLHNNLVQWAAIWGLPGLVLALGFLLVLWWRLRRLWRRLAAAADDPDDPDDPDDHALARGWVLAAVGVWWGFLVAGMFEWYFGDAEVALLTWLVCGLALGGDRLAGAAPDARYSA